MKTLLYILIVLALLGCDSTTENAKTTFSERFADFNCSVVSEWARTNSSGSLSAWALVKTTFEITPSKNGAYLIDGGGKIEKIVINSEELPKKVTYIFYNNIISVVWSDGKVIEKTLITIGNP